MVFERFTDRARRVVVLAQEESRQPFKHNYIGTEHILLGLIHEGEGVAAKALEIHGVSLDGARQQLDEIIGRGQTAPRGHIPFTPRAKNVLELSVQEALQLGHNHIGTEHILLSLIREGEGVGAQIIVKLGAGLSQLRGTTIRLLGANSAGDESAVMADPAASVVPDALPEVRPGSYPVDLRAVARGGAGVVGRERELTRMMQTLVRRDRLSLLLVGPSGVGKTALLHGLAARIEAGQAPEPLRDRRMLLLDLDGYRRTDADPAGAFTELLTACVSQNTLLCVEDAHLLGVEPNARMLDVLVDRMAGNGVQVILTVSDEAGRAVLLRDPMLRRRLVTVPVEEPNLAEAMPMLKRATAGLSAHYQVDFADEALAVAAAHAERYDSTLALPGRAVELLDEAAALARVRADESAAPEAEAEALTTALDAARRAKEAAIEKQDFETAARHRDDERRLEAELNATRRAAARRPVTAETVTAVLELASVAVPAVEVIPAAGGAVRVVHRLLPDRDQSTAILIGTATYTDERLPDLPSVASNLDDLRAVLTDPENGAFAGERVHVFADPDWDDIARIAALAVDPVDTLLIYYAGHGFAEDDGLYLGLTRTNGAHTEVTSFPYAQLRKLVLRGAARRCVIILDCCYAGTAIGWMSGDEPSAELDIRGAYVLTATARTDKAHAPEGARNSAFTEALLHVLRDGISGAGEVIRIEDLLPALTRHLRANGRPLPRQRASDTIGDLAIGRNPSWQMVSQGA
ncbi:Clp protease N-terminal domain-containing protein [Solwaraspora sp. WMMD1047]|uniref:caspase, EACC1-associated type n=1 Tax=Solwaraspora sp. WMMD1047 TaxID=3016102 RepID=UPI002416D637|nr:Clp protease N-terminal domain-containing protein [Solwaraspora sp. WMMD1047]MDG4828979.1 Clp protease N-terminal domain-containing protein [Solwaraspora sp. WMMD1047]